MVQPIPKQMTREQKEEKVEEFKTKIEDYPVVGLLDMHNLPSRQLQQMKKEMKEFADIKMSRKTLMQIAIEKAEKEDIEQLEDNDATQPAFIFSNKDPFQLYQLIQENKTSAAAQGGETAPNDIVVPEGDTGIGPGPMLGKLQQAGLQVQVDDGSIHVQNDGVIVEKGETITAEDAEILNQMGIEPLEIGLTLDVAYNEGELFSAEELDIDTEQYRTDVEAAASQAFNLAVNAGIINETTAQAIVSEAVQKAKNLAISEGLPEEETIEEAISYAASGAEAVDSETDIEAAKEDLQEDEAEENGDSEEEEETVEDSEDESEEKEEE
ncbi:50S ribosomal protein L10 [Candidatus Nanohalobium constans]|uniref:Large ribosomal subunit protein uL10 n=1 Tax=Candidatus Nanohalobium constans TaxID=2565781 RepID=A0A5Q0UEP3_9ARCH|nr:50S ribosomal protein L10 [Candidatus Nanohalobium constans]QGA80007.1 50S ribosomal protein L10 [Candidatus Nanohalobium constans]